MSADTFKPGDRVQLHPATDLWMRGARYATVIEPLPRRELTLKCQLDSGRIVFVRAENLLHAERDVNICGTCGTEVNPHTGGCPWKCNVDRAGAIGPAKRTKEQ